MSDVEMLPKANDILKKALYFSDLDHAALTYLEQATFRRVYNAEQVILLEGEPCEGMYILEKGWLKVSRFGLDGREQILQMLGPGDVFNSLSVFNSVPNQATVTALENSAIWLIQREALLKLLEEYPILARQIIGDLAEKVQYLIRMVEDLSLRSVESRLARLLLEQSEGEAVQRHRWATQAEMSSRLGTVPDVLNRALRRLAEKEMIRVERHQIQILDKKGLKNIAQTTE